MYYVHAFANNAELYDQASHKFDIGIFCFAKKNSKNHDYYSWYQKKHLMLN